VGTTSQLFSVLYGLWNFSAVRSDLQTAYGLAEQLCDMADRTDDSALQLVAHWTQGMSHSWYGHFIPACEHLERVLALYDPVEHGPLVAIYGQDAKVTALSYGALILWLSGYPDQARQRGEEALALGQELGVPFNVAYALANATLVHQFCQEVQRTRERAGSTIAFATEHGFPHMKNWGVVLEGWALAAQDQREVGIPLLRQGLAALTALARIIHEDVRRNGSPLLRSEVLTTFGPMAKERADGRGYCTIGTELPSNPPNYRCL
jgi:adenylate cyclase